MPKPPKPEPRLNPEFWREMNPQLTIGDAYQPDLSVNMIKVVHRASDMLGRDGYFQLPPQFDEQVLNPLRDAIKALAHIGIPPVYIYLYDQPWAIFADLRQLISNFLGDDFVLLPNFWAWNISSVEGARGWPPHQDCAARTRFPDGAGGDVLLSLSLWVPLSDATLKNGCMAVLPRLYEHYYNMPLDDPGIIKPEHSIALPAKAGSVLGWTQDLYHWSNRVTVDGENPRLSLSFEFQNRAFEPLAEPLLDVTCPPSFETRLELISKQFEKYQHMETMDFPTYWGL